MQYTFTVTVETTDKIDPIAMQDRIAEAIDRQIANVGLTGDDEEGCVVSVVVDTQGL